jgi:hypothetical protein
MNFQRRKIALIAAALVTCWLSSTATALTVTTFNLEWFGRGGDLLGTEQDEYRFSTIKEFVDNQLGKTELFVFEEITHLDAIRRILPGWDCRTYDVQNTHHQHVAACLKPGFSMTDSTIESVRLNGSGLRPAYVVTVSAPTGEKITVVGLHLKAGMMESATRLQQAQMLMRDLKVDDNQPLMIVGDFNTYPKEKTGLQEDDAVSIGKVFQTRGLAQFGGDQQTYLGGGRTFDRVWTKNINNGSFWVKGACVNDPQGAGRYNERSFYSRFVSDHCAVTVTVSGRAQP